MSTVSSDTPAGFTLIEIVMTLILIGILAGAAIPKNMDLSAEAERRAAAAAVAEAQIRINGLFASRLFAGTPCEEARREAKDLSKTADEAAEGGYRYGAIILSPESVSEDSNTAGVSAVSADSGRALGKVGSLRYPICTGPFEAELPGSSAGGGSSGSAGGGEAPGSRSGSGEDDRPEAGGGTESGGSAGNGSGMGSGGSSSQSLPSF